MSDLSNAQKRVMAWLGKGWTTNPGAGASVMINGKRACNQATMESLQKRGLVERDALGCWKATEAGKSITRELNL